MRMLMLDELESGMVLAKDLYDPSDDKTPILRSGALLTGHTIHQLHGRGIYSVYVQGGPAGAAPPQAGEAGAPAPKPAAGPDRTIDPELQQQTILRLVAVFELVLAGNSGQSVNGRLRMAELEMMVGRLADAVCRGHASPININTLKSYNDFLYHHSLSVAVLSLAMGGQLGYDAQRLRRLGLSALLHDIGEANIPIDVITKTGDLDEDERALIRSHPAVGYQLLREADIGDEEVRLGVLGHHEKVDGTGYPKGARALDISAFARIIAVADVYDALTSHRPYRQPKEPPEAIEFIMGGAGSAFDFDMVQALVQKIDMYPVGSRVLLSDGQVAKVVDNENMLRPIIKMEATGRIIDLFRNQGSLSLVITQLLV